MSEMTVKAAEGVQLTRREPGQAAEAVMRLLKTPSGRQGVYWRGGELMLWAGSRWRVLSVVEAMDLMLLLLKDAVVIKRTEEEGERKVRLSPSVGFVEDTLRFVQAMARTDSDVPGWKNGPGGEPDAAWCIPFEDVVLDVKTGKTWTRDETWFGTMVLPVRYEDLEGAKAERWAKCVEQWACGDAEWGPLLQMSLGYMLMPVRRLRKCLLIQGETGGGKGVIQHVVRAMMGRALQISNMEALADKHGTVGLGSAQGLWVPEVTKGRGESARTVARLFKEIVGEDGLTINPKFGQVERGVKCGAMLVMTSNVVPQLENERGGLTNKMLMLPIRKSFDKGGAEVGLKDRLVREELAGIVGWAVEGARRVAKEVEERGEVKWPKPEVGVEMEEAFLVENSPVAAFQAVCFEKAAKGFVAGELVRRAWKAWVRDQLRGREPEGVSEHNLLTKLEDQGMWGVVKSRNGSGGSRGMRGMVLRATRKVE